MAGRDRSQLWEHISNLEVVSRVELSRMLGDRWDLLHWGWGLGRDSLTGSCLLAVGVLEGEGSRRREQPV